MFRNLPWFRTAKKESSTKKADVPTPSLRVDMNKTQLRRNQTLGQYHDCMAVLMLKAPDNFRNVLTWTLVHDQKRALRDEFDLLRSDFYLVERRLKDPHLSRIARELIEMSYDAFSSGDRKKGAHVLGECAGLIWPSEAVRPKYAVEAERRAFGVNSLYKDVVISPYPYEGSAADLGTDQAALLALAVRWCRTYQAEGREFLTFSWVMANDGTISRTSALPKEDDHPVLQPVQRSFGFKRLKQLAHEGHIRACVLAQASPSRSYGVLVYDVEEIGRPRVSARQIHNLKAGEMRYDQMRYHLEDSVFFPESSGDVGAEQD
jgi:hypothetical protein